MTETRATSFDFAAFKQAFETQDVEGWLAFYDDQAEWVEYRHKNPPRAPNRMTAKDASGAFLHRVKGSNVQLSLSDEVIGPTRAAFCVTCTLPNGDRIIENVIVHHKQGKIARQVDVEAWD
jgi:hypothetical protein